MFDHLAMSSEI